MCRGIIGKKIGMTCVFSPDGDYVPVTIIKAGLCVVVQKKTLQKDGYNALQVGFEEKKAVKVNKPMSGHFKKSGGACYRYLREFGVDDPDKYEVGQAISADMFKIGQLVDVVGTIKGRGFAGVIKRHGFHGGGQTHGSHSHRVPGSIGCSAWPAKVIKGKKMPGHYGNTRQTTRNLEVVDIRKEENLILLRGAVPGSKTGLLEIKKRKFLE